MIGPKQKIVKRDHAFQAARMRLETREAGLK